MPEEQEDTDSFYAALNVSRGASDAEIKKAYRQLAQIYHPDKHTDPQLKARAEASFTRLQAAYEVILPRLFEEGLADAGYREVTLPISVRLEAMCPLSVTLR